MSTPSPELLRPERSLPRPEACDAVSERRAARGLPADIAAMRTLPHWQQRAWRSAHSPATHAPTLRLARSVI